MLQAIRDKVTGWIAYGIIFLISIPFALWGVNSYLGGGEVAPAATVNGEEISQQQFDLSYNNYRQRLAQMFGGSIPESFASESVLRTRVLDQLIEETALRQYIDNQHYRIGDDTLAGDIRNMDEFKRDGQFNSEIYEAQLRSIGMSPLAFEQRLRVSGAMDQFQDGLRATAFITPAEREQYSGLNNQSRKIRSLRYRPEPGEVTVEPGEIEQYFLANSERYRTADQIRIDFIELSLDSVKQNIVVSEDDVRARYQDNLESYTAAEFREASHILIKIDDKTDDAAALVRIIEIRERIVSGEGFAALAAELSEDPVSGADGGSLGEVGRGDMVPSFETALFSLSLEELSEPVKTQFGWHLILVQSISGGETQDFIAVKAALEDEIKIELAEVQIYELVEGVANLAYEQPDSLLPAAEQLGFSVQTSDWFDRSSGTGIAADAKIRQLAFGDEVLEQGRNSEAIELGGQRVVFIRLNERRAPQAQPLEQVEDSVRAKLLRQKTVDRSLKTGAESLASLRSGATLEDVASEWSARIEDHGFVSRNESGVDSGILSRSFTMAQPEQGLVFDGLSVDGGAYAIIELSAVVSNNSELDEESVNNLLRTQGGAEYQAALKYLGSRSAVVKTPYKELQL
jgi:peptidyl-prolyl cis-trans isomerase D